jgi:hypothetical protein
MMCAVALVAVGCHTGTPEGGPRDNGAFPTSSGLSKMGEPRPQGNSTGRVSAFTTSDLGMLTTVPVPLDSAYSALTKAYATLGLPVTTNDPAEHTVGNRHVVVLHKMMGRNLSAFFSCGIDAVMGRQRADTYKVSFSMVSTLTKNDAGSTRVITLVTGMASDIATSASDVYCSSTGVLETALLNAAGYQPN